MRISQKSILVICALLFVIISLGGGYYYYYYGDNVSTSNVPTCISQKFSAAGRADGMGVCNVTIEDSDNCSSEDVSRFNTTLRNMCNISNTVINQQPDCARETFRSNIRRNVCEVSNLDLSSCDQSEATGVEVAVNMLCGSVDNLQLPERDRSNSRSNTGSNAGSNSRSNTGSNLCSRFSDTDCSTGQIVNPATDATGALAAECCIADPGNQPDPSSGYATPYSSWVTGQCDLVNQETYVLGSAFPGETMENSGNFFMEECHNDCSGENRFNESDGTRDAYITCDI